MNPFVSLVRPIEREEEMDALELDEARYARVLRDLARVNLVTLAHRPTLRFVTRLFNATPQDRRVRLLDVGFGQGDMLRAIARLAKGAGRSVDLVGIDLNPRSEGAARDATPVTMPIHWITGDYQALGGQGWDAVISSLVTHHMSDTQRQDFLQFMEAESALGWFVNDLHRLRFPFMGFPVLATLLGADPIVRRDGQLSIGRSFRADEWQAMLNRAGIRDALVERWFPARLCVARVK